MTSLLGKKGQSSTYFAHFQVVIVQKMIQKIIIKGQINIDVNGEYLPQEVSSCNCQ